jgi:predicted aspartyl protease
MMQGFVNQRCEAVLPIVVKNDTITQLVDAVIDTGFSGFLTLPTDIIAACNYSALNFLVDFDEMPTHCVT